MRSSLLLGYMRLPTDLLVRSGYLSTPKPPFGKKRPHRHKHKRVRGRVRAPYLPINLLHGLATSDLCLDDDICPAPPGWGERGRPRGQNFWLAWCKHITLQPERDLGARLLCSARVFQSQPKPVSWLAALRD